jgi:hypothetical protein
MVLTRNQFVGVCLVAVAGLLTAYYEIRSARISRAMRVQSEREGDVLAKKLAVSNQRVRDLETSLAPGVRGEELPKSGEQKRSKSSQTKVEGRSVGAAFDAKASRAASRQDLLRKQFVRNVVKLEMNDRPVFERLGLSTALWEQYETLMLNFTRPVSEADESKVRDLLGDEVEAALKQHQAAQEQRAKADQLTNYLLFSDSPLTPEQTDQFVRFTEKNKNALSTYEELSADVSLEAEGILSQKQFTAWNQLREVDKALNRMSGLMEAEHPHPPAAIK